jgi:hypothetical protein
MTPARLLRLRRNAGVTVQLLRRNPDVTAQPSGSVGADETGSSLTSRSPRAQNSRVAQVRPPIIKGAQMAGRFD